MKIKALIFDFDGTLVDSESIHFDSWRALLKDGYGVDFEEQDYFQNFAGIPSIEISEQVKKRYGIERDVHELTKKKEAIAKEKAAMTKVTFMPFAREVLEDVRKKNIPFSIVTGSSRDEMETVLINAGIFDFFDYTITRDDVKLSKPNPEGYIKCAELMGYDLSEYLVFEDTWTGVTAAKRASLSCFGIQKTIAYRPKLITAGANHIFSNLKDAFDYLEENNWHSKQFTYSEVDY